MAKRERNRRIREEASNGRTYQEIADDFGISRQRVDQIVKPRRDRARSALALAVAAGKVRRPDRCERCGEHGEIEGHHPDYSRPLEVEWLCRACHRDEHAGDERRVPAKFLPIDRACASCGSSFIAKPSSSKAYCSAACVGESLRLPEDEVEHRFQEMASTLREFVRKHGYIPGVTEFAMSVTGKEVGSSAVAPLAISLDPSRGVSYAAKMDRLYETAGLPRPRYGKLPLSAVNRGPFFADHVARLNRSEAKRAS